MVITLMNEEFTIRHYADWFTYDPDGLCGPATPRDEALENELFGEVVVRLVPH